MTLLDELREAFLPVDAPTGRLPAQRPRFLRLPLSGPALPDLLRQLRRHPELRGLAVHVPGGLSLRGTVAGSRLRHLARALASRLAAESVASLLPWLRRGRSDHSANAPGWQPRLTRRRALALLLGTGADSAPTGPCRWEVRVARRHALLRHRIAAQADESRLDPAARRTVTIERQQAERWVRDVEPILAALADLDRLQDLLEGDADAIARATAILDFARSWVALSEEPPGLWESLATILTEELEVPDSAATGPGALDRALDRVRLPTVPADQAALWIVSEDGPVPPGVEPILSRRADPIPPRSTPGAGSPIEPGSIAIDGDLRAAGDRLALPGLAAQRPLSATAFGSLLACPWRFLQQRVLRRHTVPSPPARDRIEPLTYGKVFHAAAEEFLQEAGPALCRREGSPEDWQGRARAVGLRHFEALMGEYPLWGEARQASERQRLLDQMEGLVRDEWQREPRQFLAIEPRFGEPRSLRLPTPGGAVYLRGSMDRLDLLADGRVSVRDWKTGALQPVERIGPHAARDLQLGIYVLVLAEGGLGERREVGEAAYVQPHASLPTQRTFREDNLDRLREATGTWLGVARDLLVRQVFPRTTDARDCHFCAFRPLCGSDAARRSAARLSREEEPALRRFLELRRQNGGEPA